MLFAAIWGDIVNNKNVMLGTIAFILVLAFAIWNSAGTSPGQNGTNYEDFDPSAAPKEAIQRSWRTGENSAFLQYTYTAPNSCWQKGNNQTLLIGEQAATLTLVPQIVEGFCAQVMTALTYDQELEIPAEIEVLIVIVDHQEGGLIEKNELWIEPQNQ